MITFFLTILNVVALAFLIVVLALVALCLLVGAFVVYQVLKKQKPPADESNRLGHIALIWESCTAPHRFAEFRPYLKYDVSEWAKKLKETEDAD